MRFSWSQEPSAAIAYLRKKKPERHFDYDEIMHEAHHKAFTVAKITELDLLSDIQDSLIRARREGISFAAWKKELKPTLKQKGWWGRTEVANPKTGEVKEIYVGSRRLRNIFYTNTRVAYNVGRAQAQYQLPDAVYLRYVAILDSRVRPKHAKNHGIIRHRDDPFWATHYPPNGWNCRCRVQAYSKAAIARRGWEEKLSAPLHDIAHPDWRYDVRKGSRFFDTEGMRICFEGEEHNATQKPCPQTKPSLLSYREYGLPSLAKIDRGKLDKSPKELPKSKTNKEAVQALSRVLLGNKKTRTIKTPIIETIVDVALVEHVINHHPRSEARERYAHYIVPTLETPLEIWATDEKDTGSSYKRRFYFIKMFQEKGKNIFVVVKLLRDGAFVWTVIKRSKLKGLDNKRVGVLLYNDGKIYDTNTTQGSK